MIKLADIAKLAHVSKSAASLALNDKPGVSEATRQRVKAIVADSGYKPLRQKSVTKQFDLIAIKSSNIITDDFSQQAFFQKMLGLFANEINHFQARLNIMTLTVEEFKSGKFPLSGEGAILIGTDLSAQTINLVEHVQPNLVIIDTSLPTENKNFVTMDSFQGSYQAAKYLANQGFQRFGYISSKIRIHNFDERRRGFEAGLAATGHMLDLDNVYSFSPIVPHPKSEEISGLIHRRNLPDVFFCEDDYIAIELLKICQKHRISVPRDVAIMGFDDINEDQLVYPEISSVHVPIREMVLQTLTTLTKLVSGELTANVKIHVQTRIIERQSTSVNK